MRPGEDAMLAEKLCREKWAELSDRTEVKSMSLSSSASTCSSCFLMHLPQLPLRTQQVMVRTMSEKKMMASAM
jgi:hypothetical protein